MSQEEGGDKHDESKPALLPCPFCAVAPRIKTYPVDPYRLRGHIEISCENNHCPAQVVVEESSEGEAAAHWNRRTSRSSVATNENPLLEFVATMAREYGPEAGEAARGAAQAWLLSTSLPSATAVSDVRLRIIEAALQRFPDGNDIYGQYRDWKDQLDKALDVPQLYVPNTTKEK